MRRPRTRDLAWRFYQSIHDASVPMRRAVEVARGLERWLDESKGTDVLLVHAWEQARNVVTLLEGVRR